MRSICKNPACPRQGKAFTHERAGAQYCSLNCRVAAHRQRQAPAPLTWWNGKEPGLAATSRSLNSDGSAALSNAELGERLIKIAEQDDDGEAKTGRRFYYLALSYGYIQPDMSATDAGKKSRDAAYKRITHILGVLRMRDEIGWDMVLDLTRELDEWQTYTSPREARAALRDRYDEDRWVGQPYYPILIVEKDTLEPVCKPMAQGWQMPFASSRGYGSLTLQHDVAQMLRERHAKTGQRAKIFFISDLDPSGLDLQRAWEEALDNFRVEYKPIVRIGLTIEQVGTIDNARLRQGIEVKEGDVRSASYIAEHGERCWETDILPAAAIEAALDADIRSWLDTKLWDRRAREIDRARALH
jgi:hypothetical protein